MMESFFSSFKAECIEGRTYQSRSQARQAIFEYLETFYNRQRLHSSLEYQSPVQFEQQNTWASKLSGSTKTGQDQIGVA
jgi:putative transposase